MVEVGGASLWVSEEGKGFPMLLANGGPGCCDYLGPVSAMVNDLVRVIRFEQRGCGRSSAGGPFDLATTLSDVEAIRDHLGIERWIVGGHSWGADLALAYALHFPERTAGVLYLAGTGVQNDRSWSDAYKKGVAEGKDPLPEFQYPINRHVNEEGVTSWREFIRRPDLLRRLSQLQMPLIAVHGSEDVRPGWPAAQVAELVPGGQFQVLEGAPHCMWMTHAGALSELLRRFLHEMIEERHTGAREPS